MARKSRKNMPPRSLLSRSVWPIKQTLRIRTPPEKKAPCKSANAEVKNKSHMEKAALGI